MVKAVVPFRGYITDSEQPDPDGKWVSFGLWKYEKDNARIGLWADGSWRYFNASGITSVTSDSTLKGDGTSDSPHGVDLTHDFTWTGEHTFGDDSVGIDQYLTLKKRFNQGTFLRWRRSGSTDAYVGVDDLENLVLHYDVQDLGSNPEILIKQGSSGTVVARFNGSGRLRAAINHGTTANRPASPATWEMYGDDTLGIPIWYDGTNWVDATGATV